jgi:flagellar hook-associated protein 2
MSASISNLITIATFSGQSKYASDFQNVLTRAVELQSLNLDNMQVEQTTDQNRQSALQSLDQQFTSLQTAISNLSSATGVASLSSSISNPSVGTVSLSTGATPATYTLEVQSVGSYSQSYSSSGLSTVTDPNSQNISSSNSFTLTVGSNTYNITGSTLQDVANAINGNSSYGVTASIVNAGSSSSPDYRLALQASSLGAVNIQLNDGSQNLLTSLSTGTSASYYVDGLPNAITSNSDTVTLGPGVTVNLTGTNSGSPATITVTQDGSSIENALQSFANAYNAVVTQLAASHGTSANALQGDSILSVAQQALRNLLDYTGANGSAMSSLGLDLQDTGQLTFSSSEFEAATSSGISPALQFLGDSTSGFIQAATSAIDSLEDPISGSIKTEEQDITTSLSNLSTQMNNEVDRINSFQQNLLTQLSAADANIYSLENETSYYTDYFNYNSNSSSTGS